MIKSFKLGIPLVFDWWAPLENGAGADDLGDFGCPNVGEQFDDELLNFFLFFVANARLFRILVLPTTAPGRRRLLTLLAGSTHSNTTVMEI